MGLDEIRKLKTQAKMPKEKKVYRIPKKSPKKIAQEKDPVVKSDRAELERWFKERDKEAVGVCRHCGGKSCKGNPQYFKFSIAHILPKRIFKSVATHPLNWIELCYFNKSCHTNWDNGSLDWVELNCFDEVVEKFIAMYPSIDPKERRHIPDVLRQYVNIDI